MPITPFHIHLLRRLESINRAHRRQLITDWELIQALTFLLPLLFTPVVSIILEHAKEVWFHE